MNSVLDPLRSHQRRRASAMNSGPLSQRTFSGAPRLATISSKTATTPLAVIERATWPARDSRVNSSVMLRTLILLPREMSSNRKSIAHTGWGETQRWDLGRVGLAAAASSWPGPAGSPVARSFVPACGSPSSPPGTRSRAASCSPDASRGERVRAGADAGAPRRERGFCGGAGMSGAGRPGRMPFSRRPRSDPAGVRSPDVDARGLPISPGHVLEHVDVQRLVGDELLQPAVLPAQVLQLDDLFPAHPLVLLLPPVEGLHGDLEGSADLIQRLAFGKHPFTLAQLSDHLLGRVSGPLHGTHLLPLRAS